MSSSTFRQIHNLSGWISDMADALIIMEAESRAMVPSTNRRFTDMERPDYIRSGSILVYSETETGIKRWTDGKSWSCSRVDRNFLLYREKSNKPPRAHNIDEYSDEPVDPETLRRVLGSLLDQHKMRFKKNGLMKRTFTVTRNDDTKYHLINYYRPRDVLEGHLRTPSQMIELQALLNDIAPDLLQPKEPYKNRPHIRIDGGSGRLLYAGEYDGPPLSFSSQGSPLAALQRSTLASSTSSRKTLAKSEPDPRPRPDHRGHSTPATILTLPHHHDSKDEVFRSTSSDHQPLQVYDNPSRRETIEPRQTSHSDSPGPSESYPTFRPSITQPSYLRPVYNLPPPHRAPSPPTRSSYAYQDHTRSTKPPYHPTPVQYMMQSASQSSSTLPFLSARGDTTGGHIRHYPTTQHPGIVPRDANGTNVESPTSSSSGSPSSPQYTPSPNSSAPDESTPTHMHADPFTPFKWDSRRTFQYQPMMGAGSSSSLFGFDRVT